MKEQIKNQLLLLADVTNLGRKGDLVYAKPGFVRNFLLPQKKAVLADRRSIRMRQRLQQERAKQAALDKKDAQSIADKLRGFTLSMMVKTDTQGHLYGSVSAQDIVKRLAEEGITIDRRNVVLLKPIKFVGIFDINLNLKEHVSSTFTLKVLGDKVIVKSPPHVKKVEESEKSQDSSVEEGGKRASVHSKPKEGDATQSAE